MVMELRKRKAPPPPAAPSKKPTKATKAAPKVKETKEKVKEKAAEPAASTNGSSDAPKADVPKPAVGDTITLDGFGGEVTLNDGTTTTLKALVDESKAGVALFTYPKASTPGCTQQACLFRDSHPAITTTAGLSIYGLSTDSPKANTTFQTKQKLPYPLLCDPQASLIAAIGLKKAPKGTTRGVFVVDKEGKVLAAGAGSPKGTVEVVLGVVEGLGAEEKGEDVKEGEEEEVKVEKKEANGEGKEENGEENGEEENGEEEEEEKKDE